MSFLWRGCNSLGFSGWEVDISLSDVWMYGKVPCPHCLLGVLISGAVQHLVVCWQPSVSWLVAVPPRSPFSPFLFTHFYPCAVCLSLLVLLGHVFMGLGLHKWPHLNCLSAKTLFPEKVTFIGPEELDVSVFWKRGTQSHSQPLPKVFWKSWAQ